MRRFTRKEFPKSICGYTDVAFNFASGAGVVSRNRTMFGTEGRDEVSDNRTNKFSSTVGLYITRWAEIIEDVPKSFGDGVSGFIFESS